MNNPNANVSASNPDTTIVHLEREIAAFEYEQAQLRSRIRALRDAEAQEPATSHAAEIFALQQEKLRLDTEILFRRNKIRLLHSQWA
ncbi:MAG TPA: hypothetical protein DEU72_04765 [Desulfomicrobiaceae bacterium]|jgi:hypothetical protein|nr:hypothetical protein [Desulfomicrobiaceae bacterium]